MQKTRHYKYMAAFSVIGFVDSIKLIDGACLLFLSEYKKGYRKKSGEIVDDKYISWRIIFKDYFKKYLIEHFGKGMLVEVKGEVFPYVVEHGEIMDGISVLGQCVNMFSYPRASLKQEVKMMTESQVNTNDKPNIEDFNTDDF